MKKIETLSSINGRRTLIKLFKELRYEKQLSSFMTLFLTWRICIRERELWRYMKEEVTVLHPLGLISGTSLWMQEIVNRFYFSTVNSFVYFGAAILLALIGIRRFSDHVSDTMVIFGVAFEALMLVFMFIIMLFSSNDEALEDIENDEDNSISDIILEIGEIGRDFAGAVSQLENISGSVNEMIRQQVDLINIVNQIAKNSADAISPNPKMLDVMRTTNIALEEFKNSVENFNVAADKLKKEEIEIAVRNEVERILLNKLINNNNPND